MLTKARPVQIKEELMDHRKKNQDLFKIIYLEKGTLLGVAQPFTSIKMLKSCFKISNKL